MPVTCSQKCFCSVSSWSPLIDTNLVVDMCRYGFITESFAKTVKFTGSPVVATPDVTELRLNNTDEFVIMASDGIW